VSFEDFLNNITSEEIFTGRDHVMRRFVSLDVGQHRLTRENIFRSSAATANRLIDPYRRKRGNETAL